MLKTLFLSLEEAAAYKEDGIESALDYILKADLLSGEQDQFLFVLAFFSLLDFGLLSLLLHCEIGKYKRLTGRQMLSVA